MRKAGLILSIGVAAVFGARQAHGVAQFQKVFMDEYIAEHENKEFAEYVTKKVKCFVCHQGKLRKNHNPYGIHLVELLDRKKDVRDVPKIKAALEKVAKMHSDPKDDKSPTYSELIAAGKLPGGELEEVQKEPKKDETK
jgi:hypothetical protein